MQIKNPQEAKPAAARQVSLREVKARLFDSEGRLEILEGLRGQRTNAMLEARIDAVNEQIMELRSLVVTMGGACEQVQQVDYFDSLDSLDSQRMDTMHYNT